MKKYALIQRQSLPLIYKVRMSLSRIRTALIKHHHNAYISISGGRDSLVLQELVKMVDKSVPSVFVDTGVEWPSVRKSALAHADVVLRPKRTFAQVVDRFGYPGVSKDVSQKIYEIRTTKSAKVMSARICGDSKGNGKLPKKWRYMIWAPFTLSHKCCDILKKSPAKAYEKANDYPVAFVGTLAEESSMRLTNYLKKGCNSFDDNSRHISRPLSFWTDDDINQFITMSGIKVPSIYEHMGHTGCVYCLFGCAHQSFDKIELIKKLKPGMYKQAVKLGMLDVRDYIVNHSNKDML